MKQREFLTFSIGKENFAIQAKHIREVLFHQYYTKLNDNETQIAGIVNYKGKKLPVINSQSRLNIESNKIGNIIIVFEIEQYQMKYTITANANAIDDIIQVSEKDIKNCTIKHEYIDGIINVNNRKTYIINAQKFLDIPNIESSAHKYTKATCIA
ncbi:MAG: chemotaxis protein CheW [Marinilabiliaceae bacterium]|nr:chemotaxis protein CheW [Marinilabiliaceae bacterium]